MLERFLGSRVGRLASRWAFVLPLLALSLSAPTDHESVCARITTVHYLVPFYVSCLGGAAWQLLRRRDVVARLSIWSGVLVVAVGAGPLLLDHQCATNYVLGLVPALGVAAGVMLVEEWHRRRDKKADTRLPFAEHELRELR